MTTRLLALDQGTSSTRAILFDEMLRVVAIEQEPLTPYYPRPGWVEQDPEEIWTSSLGVMKRVLERTGTPPHDVAALGITNQRETTIIWDRESGRAIHRAIVWQDRRTADLCGAFQARGLEAEIRAKTGLVLDPYFSATKIAWILDTVPGARARATKGDLCFGTVDSFLLWRLTGGRVHATDATNASRTLLYHLSAGVFDETLLELFDIPAVLLPVIRDSSAHYGVTERELLGGSVLIGGIAGDQQAATVGQGCFEPGMMKATYGTGAFILLNTGSTPSPPPPGLLATVAFQLDGARTFALEGAIFSAGTIVKWLRDQLGLIRHAAESATLARSADEEQRVYLVPAFVGLGAPYWRPDARAALFGLTLATGVAEVTRAALESIAYQTQDLLEAMCAGRVPSGDGAMVLRVDGGMVANDWMLQFLADIVNVPVERPPMLETTALGAAYLAGLAAAVCPGPREFSAGRSTERVFLPSMNDDERASKLAGWHEAVARTLHRP